MHEVSLCESVIEIVEQYAVAERCRRVKKVWLEVGTLAAVEPDAMHFSFDAVSKGTVAEGAELSLIKVLPEVWCAACEAEVTIDQRFDACPKCGGYQLHISGGDSLRVKELEVE